MPAASASTCSCGVAVTPGAIALTATPRGPSARAADRTSEMIPPFDAAYADASGQPDTPHSEAMQTIRP